MENTYSTIRTAVVDVLIKRGDRTKLDFTFNLDGNPLDLAQFTSISFKVKKNKVVKYIQIEKEIPDMIIVDNQLEIILTETDTNLKGGNYVFDIRAKNNIKNNIILEGKFIIEEDV